MIYIYDELKILEMDFSVAAMLVIQIFFKVLLFIANEKKCSEFNSGVSVNTVKINKMTSNFKFTD